MYQLTIYIHIYQSCVCVCIYLEDIYGYAFMYFIHTQLKNQYWGV